MCRSELRHLVALPALLDVAEARESDEFHCQPVALFDIESRHRSNGAPSSMVVTHACLYGGELECHNVLFYLGGGGEDGKVAGMRRCLHVSSVLRQQPNLSTDIDTDKDTQFAHHHSHKAFTDLEAEAGV